MRVALLLLAYAGVVCVVGTTWLRCARWVDRAPRLGLLVWQAVSVSFLAAITLAGLAVAVPASHLGSDLADLLHACVMALRARYATPGGAATGFAGAVLAAGVLGRIASCLVAATHAARRERRRHTEMLAVVARRHRRTDALVVDHAAPAVYCLPGRQGRIVLTSAALDALGEDELRAVLAHEQAHLRERHDVAVTAALAFARAFPRIPLLTAARDEIARLAELAADDAAGRVAGRLSLAEALLAVAGSPAPAATLAAAASDTGRRVRRLLAPANPLGLGRTALTFAVAAAVLALPASIAAQPALAVQHVTYCPVDVHPQSH